MFAGDNPEGKGVIQKSSIELGAGENKKNSGLEQEEIEELIVIGSSSSEESSSRKTILALEEYQKTVPFVNLGHFFIPTSPRMKKKMPQIETNSESPPPSSADGQNGTKAGQQKQPKRQHRLATSSSIVFDQSQQNCIQITHQNYMSIVDFSPTTPPANLPKFPTNPSNSSAERNKDEGNCANYDEPPPKYSEKVNKMMGAGSSPILCTPPPAPPSSARFDSRQCFDEKNSKTSTELILMKEKSGNDREMANSVEELEMNEEGGERETWGRKIDFLLSVVGFAVDLANVWRFPYLCFKNGGGAFLIPYTMMVLLAGIPLFYMELALGQFHRKGAITTWGKICPLFKGIGYCVIMTAFYTDFFYNVIIAYALHYFYASFTTQLPWGKCTGEYNSPACYEPSSWSDQSDKCAQQPILASKNGSFSAEQIHQPISAAEEYFYKHFLGLHASKASIPHVQQSINDLGPINWEIVICLLVVYLICYFSLWKGIKMSGKVVWFTAIFPYVVLVCLLIRGITLPGSEKGIAYYLSPELEKLKDPGVWQDAATQVFFSLGPGFGVLMAYSSYNEFHNNVYFDALLTSTINCATSFLAGFVIFSVLGYMSCKSGKPIDEVAQEGPGLVFVVYPEALATMPGATVWSLIFFLMLLTLGLDSSFGGSEAIITGLSDEFPIIKKNREIFVAGLFIFYMLIGLTMCTKGGMLVMEWLIVYGTTWGLLIAVFCETMVISFCYGIRRFCGDIREMLGFEPGWYWRICWTIGAPIFLIAMILSSFINLMPLQYQDYIYPPGANLLGIIFALSSVSAIPLVGIWVLAQTKGNTFGEKFRNALRPAADANREENGLNGISPLLRPEMVRATRVTFARVNSSRNVDEAINVNGEEEHFLHSTEHDDVLL